MVTTFPKQRLPFKEKMADDCKWGQNTINHIINHYTMVKKDYDDLLSNYQLYNNILNQEDFQKECNPLGFEDVDMDAIVPYNKTYNKIQVLLGELAKRNYNPKAILINSEGIKSKLAEKDQALQQIMQQQIDAIFQGKNPPDVEKEIQNLSSNKFLSSKEIKANKLLTFFKRNLSIDNIRQDTFKHGLISGKEIAYLDVEENRPVLKPINPLGFFYDKSPDVKYIQDGMVAGYKYTLSINEIIDNFQNYLKEEDIEKLEKYQTTSAYGMHGMTDKIEYHDQFIPYTRSDDHGQYYEDRRTQLIIHHVEWKSQKRIGFIYTTNPFGEEEVIMVDENFVLPVNVKKQTVKKFGKSIEQYIWDNYLLEWEWVEETWEGTRIGTNIYTKVQPKDLQYRSIFHPRKSKLGYYGVVYSNTNAKQISLMSRMKPYQYLYFITVHRLKKLIQHDNIPLIHIDTTMIDPTFGIDKTLYYMQELGIDFYNPYANADSAASYQKSKITGTTDRSTMRYINNYIQLLDFIDSQISDVAGISKQREGLTAPTEAVTNAQNNIAMSSLITEIYFNVHYSLWDQIYSGLIETFKILKPATYQFILDDASLATIKLESDEFLESDFGIFTASASKEHDVYQTLQSLTQPLLQNDKVTLSELIKLLKSESLEELEKDILQGERDREQQKQQEFQQQQQLQQQQIDAQKEAQERQFAHEIQLKEIESYKFVEDQDANNDGLADQLQIEELKLKHQQAATSTALELKKLAFAEKKHEDDIKLKNRQLTNKK